MRLVDADKILNEDNAAYSKSQEECNDEWSKNALLRIHKAIQGLLAGAPTAYDINKVIDNLHEPAEYINGKYYITVENAIAIVRGGGIDE